ncbi:glutathione S-transferase family protein [Brevundimonas sp.]|uniref:glutathione S-transferase family protein n=1 Tax=Brevundimonas sp. TaxID=1871086 RepID=UPI00260B2926|nr:glutathione S-transferase family protein [Brevundimonas sp.]
MILHWSPKSPFVRKVMVAAHEKGLTNRLALVRNPVAMTAPNAELMRANPLSKLPTLELPEGIVLQDSGVICAYLDALEGPPILFPVAGEAFWQVHARHSLVTGLLDVLILLRNERERPDGARSQPHIDAFDVKKAAALREIASWALEPCGQTIDIVQITTGCLLGYLDFRFADEDWRGAHPALAQWYETFASRPSAIATMPS